MDTITSFTHSFTAPKKQELALELVPLTPENRDIILKKIGDTFSAYEPGMATVGFTSQDVQDHFLDLFDKSIKYNLGIVCQEAKTKAPVGAIIMQDLYDRVDYTKPSKEFSEELKLKAKKFLHMMVPHIMKMKDFYKTQDKPQLVIAVSMIGIFEGYEGLGIMSKMIEFAVNGVPYARESPVFETVASNPGS